MTNLLPRPVPNLTQAEIMVIEAGRRTCKKCSVEYPATTEYFRSDAGLLRGSCRACERRYARQRLIDKPEVVRENAKRYREKYPDRVHEQAKRWRDANPDKHREAFRRWREKNIADRRAYCERWRATHQEHRRRYASLWRAKNKRRVLSYARQWRRTHPDLNRIAIQKRRAQKLAAGGTFTKADIQKLHNLQKGRCWWCGKPLRGVYHIDHRIPLSKGGSNDIANIVLAHAKCNLSKGAKLPSEFAGRLL